MKIGIVINNLISDYEKEFLSGVSKFCEENNCVPLLFPIGELNSPYFPFEYQQKIISSLITKNNVDGIIIASAILGNHVTKDEFSSYINKTFSVPKISIGIELPNIPSIIVNQKMGFESIIKDLIINHKCNDIAIMSVKGNNEDAIIRMNIIKSIFKKYNIKLDKNKIMYGRFTYDGAFTAIQDYYEKNRKLNFDGIICLNDDMAFACIDFCKKQSINVPNKLKIIGFDDVALASKDTPRLTTVNQMIANQSYEGCNILLKLINGKKIKTITKIKVFTSFYYI